MRFIDTNRLNFPKSLLDEWRCKYGPEDYKCTITKIIDVVNTVSSSDAPQALSQSAILREVCDRISNKEFINSDLGKFVLIAILAGREVDSGKFFHESAASPRANSSVLIKEVLPETDQNGQLIMSLTFVFEGFHFRDKSAVWQYFRSIPRAGYHPPQAIIDLAKDGSDAVF